MTTDKSASVVEKLRLGVDAARAGRGEEARRRFVAVLKQDPDNIPAMLWLAFLLPSPLDTIRVLERVLALDPENERARAGLRWARGRLGLNPDEPDADEPALADRAGPPAAETTPDPAADFADDDSAKDASLRRQLLSGKIQKQAKKGVLAQRARRTINPLLLIIFITGALGMMSIALGALIFAPAETLAAWLPAPANTAPTSLDIAPVAPVVSPVQPVEAPPVSAAKSFTSQVDTLISMAALQAVGRNMTKADPMVSPLEAEISSELAVPIPPAETNLTALVGPELPATEPEFLTPGDNLLLAHQPAYPGEKWIEINVTTQQVTAWEGDAPVFSFLTSTGLPSTPTVLGEFHIYWKLESTLMTGPGYYLPEVPYTMYFYGDYALHGTYWHDNFGQPMSHGCVNLETGNAGKLFEWADPVIPPGRTQVVATAANPGTLVVVHK